MRGPSEGQKFANELARKMGKDQSRDFPQVSTVQRDFYEWRDSGLWQTVNVEVHLGAPSPCRAKTTLWVQYRAHKVAPRICSHQRELKPPLNGSGT